MSDNWIRLIPEDPEFIPEATKQAEARIRFTEIAPAADEVNIIVCDKVRFFDCGGNFERVLCPLCRSDIPVQWWTDRMSEDYRDGFVLARHAMPCCNAVQKLDDLIYEWPQAFGRFALSAMNPNIGKLPHRQKEEFERILGTRLRVIYQHI